MSNDTEVEDKELADLEAQINEASEAIKDKAEETPPPEPEIKDVKEPEPKKEPEPVVAEPEAKAEGTEDPVEWAKKKGYKSPEDMARELLKKDQEYHKSRQKPPEQPQWQPNPVIAPPVYQPPVYQQPQYQQSYQRPTMREIAARYPQLAPEDVERVLPLIMDAARVISSQDRAELEQKYVHIDRITRRNNEMMVLMQDPVFKDERVQKEIHAVLDSTPSIFDREDAYSFAYEKALGNMQRKQLQQGVSNGSEDVKGNRPPITAGGGNGSANTVPKMLSIEEAERMNEKELEKYMKSNGLLPKRR